jgi:hypothetical protein
MEGISGTPEVAKVMFDRIKRSAIFIGDVTIVGKIQQDNGETRNVPNPNVSLEMGYAAGIMGWGWLICVMNEHFGERKSLPFDVRNRRFPIDYTLDPNNMSQQNNVRAKLSQWLQVAINTVNDAEYELIAKCVAALDANCLNLIALFGHQHWFPALNPSGTFLGDSLNTLTMNVAIPRMLDLKMIRTARAPNDNTYVYYWTYLGTKCIASLGLSPALGRQFLFPVVLDLTAYTALDDEANRAPELE